jgi:hypothetical protein
MRMVISKINLKILQDWSSLIERFEYFNKLFLNTPKEKAKVWSEYVRYDIGDYGSFTYYNASVREIGGVISGAMVTTLLPWIDQMKNDLSELNLAGFAFQGNARDVSPHVDGQESSDTNKHCKLNYIIDNYDDKTYAKDDQGNVEFYPSHKDTAWLLDTTKNHWIAHNTRPRYIFQLSFHQDFEIVHDWFHSKGSLSYHQ